MKFFFALTFFSIVCRAETKVNVDFEWDAILGAHLYQVELIDKQNKKTFTEQSDSEHFNFQVPIGKYQIRGRAADHRKVFGEWSPWTDLTIGPTPIKPKGKALPETLVPDRKSLKAEKVFSWEPSSGASGYRLELLDKSGKILASKVTTKNEAKFHLKPGDYQVRVTTLSTEGIESESVTITDQLTVSKSKFATPKITVDPGKNTFKVDAENPQALRYRIDFQKHLAEIDWKTLTEGDASVYETFVKQKLEAGKYRILIWLEADGWGKSDPATFEYVIKPIEKDL